MTDCLSIHDRSSRQTINSIHNTSPNAYITILVYLFHCVSSINAMFKNFSLGQVLIHWWTKPQETIGCSKSHSFSEILPAGTPYTAVTENVLSLPVGGCTSYLAFILLANLCSSTVDSRSMLTNNTFCSTAFVQNSFSCLSVVKSFMTEKQNGASQDILQCTYQS